MNLNGFIFVIMELMKKLVICCAPDSFKESMSAFEACQAMEKGIHRFDPTITCILTPMADGGEGTLEALVKSIQGRMINTQIRDPLQRNIEAKFGISLDKTLAIIEMASASGLELLKMEERNPLLTSTYGTGQLIKMALDQGVKRIVIGIGGSATNDGGSGAFRALGARFLDIDGQDIPQGGAFLDQLERIDISALDSRLNKVEILVACDVSNPLCGQQGASYIYGPQKGATQDMILRLDNNLKHFAQIIKRDLHKDIEDIPGAGAAGGLGAGLLAFTKAKLQKGIDIVIEASQLEKVIMKSDIVFTGEGKIDDQTSFGKTIMGVSALAKKHNKKVVAFAGICEKDYDELYNQGIDFMFEISDRNELLSKSLIDGPINLEKCAYQSMSLILNDFNEKGA